MILNLMRDTWAIPFFASLVALRPCGFDDTVLVVMYWTNGGLKSHCIFETLPCLNVLLGEERRQ